MYAEYVRVCVFKKHISRVFQLGLQVTKSHFQLTLAMDFSVPNFLPL